MGRVTEKPWVVNGEIKIRKILTIVYTVDHRVGDAALGVKTFKNIKKILENPNLLEDIKFEDNKCLNDELLEPKKNN